MTVTSHSSFSSLNSGVELAGAVVETTADSPRLRSLRAGKATLEATFDGNAVARTVEVSDSTASLSAAVLKAGGASSPYDFVATRGSTAQAAVALTFDDGTQFNDATDADTLDWFPLSALLTFSSAEPSKVAVDGAGTLTLLENQYERVEVSATSVCSSLSATLPVAANLHPAFGDVDLGSSSGLQFQQSSSGSALSVAVHVNMAGSTLLAFQVEVRFDYAVLGATVRRPRLLPHPRGCYHTLRIHQVYEKLQP